MYRNVPTWYIQIGDKFQVSSMQAMVEAEHGPSLCAALAGCVRSALAPRPAVTQLALRDRKPEVANPLRKPVVKVAG